MQSKSGPAKLTIYLVLVFAVFMTSWASILIRWCGETPALVISFYRLLWSFVLFGMIASRSARKNLWQLKGLSGRHFMLVLTAGAMLALHFATWIASLKYTTVAQSLVLESTHPVFAVLLSWLWLKEKSSLRTGIAVAITFVGILIIGGHDVTLAPRYFIGDMLALVSALFVTLYLLIARYLRGHIDLSPYLFAVYGSATLVLLFMNLSVGHELIRYRWPVHLLMFLLAMGPTGIGHSLINWAARHIPVYRINLMLLGELILASILAYLIFQEVPARMFFVGAPFIISGIVLALTETSRTDALDHE
ncbi:MAG: DMT family transporter [Calditrichaeota bacterium]|nr:DMT family transporter [Calditrichota bacterium]